ncbi:hypothetical protein [Fibrella aestuarina]|nr:hypothetical protein [Fibrella aestuarina]
MKELLQTIFKTTEDRLKNPFIGAFTTSWLVFNWNAILYLLFSKKDIEEKIRYIENNLSHEGTAIWLPLLSAFLYTLLLPYLNLLIDEVLNYSVVRSEKNIIRKKTNNIENQKLLAIEEIKLEDTKTEYREKRQQNNLIEELQKKVIQYEDEIKTNRDSYNQATDEFRSVLQKLEEEKANLLVSYENRLNDLSKEKDSTIEELQKTISSFSKESKIIYSFSNGQDLYESKDGTRTIYINKNNRSVYSEEEFQDFIKAYTLNKYIESI